MFKFESVHGGHVFFAISRIIMTVVTSARVTATTITVTNCNGFIYVKERFGWWYPMALPVVERRDGFIIIKRWLGCDPVVFHP
jgi:hypothetical protein